MILRKNAWFILLSACSIVGGESFAILSRLPSFHQEQRSYSVFLASSSKDDKDDNKNDIDIQRQLISRVSEINVEKVRTQLEEDNTKSFLKRRPLKLPYEASRRWVQANLGCVSKEEFYDMVENGNLRTPYIPKRPEEYYMRTREWISWEHFLTGCFDESNPSAVKPKTGVFD